eukprot:2370439-Pleurochrysis_carterae.AAC.5
MQPTNARYRPDPTRWATLRAPSSPRRLPPSNSNAGAHGTARTNAAKREQATCKLHASAYNRLNIICAHVATMQLHRQKSALTCARRALQRRPIRRTQASCKTHMVCICLRAYDLGLSAHTCANKPHSCAHAHGMRTRGCGSPAARRTSNTN